MRDGKKSPRRAHRLRQPRDRRREVRRGPGRDPRGGDQTADPGARGPLPPRRRRHLPGAGRGARPPRPHPRGPLARRLRPQPPRVLDGGPPRRARSSTRPSSRAAPGSGRTTSTAWPRPTRPSRTTAGSGAAAPMNRPLLAVDVDGVISLFGFDEPPPAAMATLRAGRRDGPLHLAGARASGCSASTSTSTWSGRPAGRRKRTTTCPTSSACRSSRTSPSTAPPASARPTGSWGRSTSTAAAGRWPGSTTASTRAATSGRASAEQPTLLVPTEPGDRPRGGPNRGADRLGRGASPPRPPERGRRLD